MQVTEETIQETIERIVEQQVAEKIKEATMKLEEKVRVLEEKVHVLENSKGIKPRATTRKKKEPTLKELKEEANTLGLNEGDVRQHGNLRKKETWINAINWQKSRPDLLEASLALNSLSQENQEEYEEEYEEEMSVEEILGFSSMSDDVFFQHLKTLQVLEEQEKEQEKEQETNIRDLTAERSKRRVIVPSIEEDIY